jgi:N-acyl-D-aspartate/D-glutamate deacylase
MTADLVIRGGSVVDGTGAPPFRSDVAINDGRIVALGKGLEGARVLDASGHLVAPGFIDIHTHYDAQVFWDPALTPSGFHGVTTVVAGNCGFSIAPTRPEHRELMAHTLENVEDMHVPSPMPGIPWDFETFPEYLVSVERRGTVLNYAAYIGHTALRLFAMGDEAYERAATRDEVEQMQAILREALLAGAAGFATGFAPTHRGANGKPVPSRFADRSELDALLDVMHNLARGVVAIAPGDQCPIDDMYDLQPRVGLPFTYGALLTTPSGTHQRLVELNRAGWARGAQVWPQITPRPLVMSMTLAEPFPFNVNHQFAALIDRPVHERRRAYADPGWRTRTLDCWADQQILAPRWDTYEIAECPTHPELEETRLDTLADKRGVEPFDALLDLALDEPDLALRVRVVLANDDQSEVASLLTEEHCTIGLSDAGAHVGQLCDAPQATDLLGTWVRDRGLMSVECAIRKLTGVQADLLGVTDRGYLRQGAWGDIVVFNLDTVAPGPTRRVRDFPANAERLTADRPTGIRHVVVNGIPIQVESERVEPRARPGQLVRSVPRTATKPN